MNTQTDIHKWMPRIDRQTCTGCQECINICPVDALGQVDGKADLVRPEACTYCTACEDVCPVNAIELPFLICFAPLPEEDSTP